VPPPGPTRRSFFKRLTVALGALAALAFSIPFIAYLFGALRKPPVLWQKLGPVDKFPLNETRLVTFDNPIHQPWDGMAAHIGVYVRRIGKDDFWMFAMNCAHLGCPVTWFSQSGLFMCPCHGGVYYENGERASGPPPRGLYHCVWRIEKGQLEVQAPHLPTLQNTLKQNG
jgi:Rieske Fe-S protein